MAATAQRLLDPIEPPLALRSDYVCAEPTVLAVSQKIFQLKGDSYVVADTAGRQHLRCEQRSVPFFGPDKQHAGPAFHMHRWRAEVQSLDGVPLYTLRRRKALTWGHDTLVEDPDGNTVFAITEKLAWSPHLHCTVPVGAGGEHLTIVGRKFKHAAEVRRDDGSVLAVISRTRPGAPDGDGRATLRNRETCYITVAPGVDLVLAVVLYLAFDHRSKAESGRARH